MQVRCVVMNEGPPRFHIAFQLSRTTGSRRKDVVFLSNQILKLGPIAASYKIYYMVN